MEVLDVLETLLVLVLHPVHLSAVFLLHPVQLLTQLRVLGECGMLQLVSQLVLLCGQYLNLGLELLPLLLQLRLLLSSFTHVSLQLQVQFLDH